ncbi:MAG: SIS domain-containing protein [Caulobacteraceae bacterium]
MRSGAAKSTRMFAEAAEAPKLVRAQLALNAEMMRRLAERLRKAPPRAVLTLGRGSSDNAATFARYLIETRLGLMTASAAPSVSSVYESAPNLEGVLCLAISQSGRSPDLLAAAQAAVAGGAVMVALVNDAASPLAELAHVVAPLRAGTELSVAATKSYLAALAAIVQLIACWTKDKALLPALAGLPELLERAWDLDWSAALPRLREAHGLYVIGRGVGFAVALEAALKLKETCGLHAEAFSAAELSHGPMALVGPGFPILAFTQSDESRQGVEAAALACAAKGADVLQAGGDPPAPVWRLPVIQAHPVLEPITYALSFYRMANALALARGFDPDRPPHLAKVTETI